jgi:quercetin dioxygenase-like cupin family protein
MAVVTPKNATLGKLSVVIFDFDKKGDILPTHTHTEGDNHITIVAKGTFKVTDHPELEGQTLKTGQVIDWQVGIPHGFIALCDNARLVNVVK